MPVAAEAIHRPCTVDGQKNCAFPLHNSLTTMSEKVMVVAVAVAVAVAVGVIGW